MSRSIVVIVNNIRSAHNVGSILRTAEGLGVGHVYLCGYTPFPLGLKDNRLPHIAKKVDSQINKTALGAEKLQAWSYEKNISPLLKKLRSTGYKIAALELAQDASSIFEFKTPNKLALLLGSEIDGVPEELIKSSDFILKIPMRGQKESFNVSVAAAIAMSYLINNK